MNSFYLGVYITIEIVAEYNSDFFISNNFIELSK